MQIYVKMTHVVCGGFGVFDMMDGCIIVWFDNPNITL